MTEEDKISLYNELVLSNGDAQQIILKKHPRDITNYNFEGVIEIEGDFPTEILTLLGVTFNKAIGVCTSAVNSINAKEAINVDEDFFNRH